MTSYNELLNKLQSQMSSANQEVKTGTSLTMKEEDTTSNILNKIGLEVQRQGGY